jgi:hypothetical protein
MLRPVLAGTSRLLIVVLGGALAASLTGIFGVVAAGIVISGAAAMRRAGAAARVVRAV